MLLRLFGIDPNQLSKQAIAELRQIKIVQLKEPEKPGKQSASGNNLVGCPIEGGFAQTGEEVEMTKLGDSAQRKGPPSPAFVYHDLTGVSSASICQPTRD
jgi:hypothetical protein